MHGCRQVKEGVERPAGPISDCPWTIGCAAIKPMGTCWAMIANPTSDTGSTPDRRVAHTTTTTTTATHTPPRFFLRHHFQFPDRLPPQHGTARSPAADQDRADPRALQQPSRAAVRAELIDREHAPRRHRRSLCVLEPGRRLHLSDAPTLLWLNPQIN